MKISNLFLLSLVSYLLSFSTGCRYSKEYQTIDAGNKFTMAVPSWLKKDDKLKAGADLQYANHYRNIGNSKNIEKIFIANIKGIL